MVDIASQIKQAAPKNAEILRVLAETDHAPPALEQQQRFLAELQVQVTQSDKKIKELDARRKSELKDHEKYRDSHMRRFMYKAAGKKERFAEKAEKEEREYLEVLQHAQREQQLNDNLRAQIADAEKVRDELAQTAQRHRDMQQELDNLYHAIFSGPTPQFPEEDQLEQKSNQALSAYHDVSTKAEAEQQVMQLLGDGMNKMRMAMLSMEDALDHSRMDMFGGGTVSDMMERNALSKAERLINEANMQVLRAQRHSPFVQELPPVRISQGDIVMDVFFDNIFTDMAFHDEIKRGREEARRCQVALGDELQKAKERKSKLDLELKQRGEELERARLELQKAREAAFERITKGEEGL